MSAAEKAAAIVADIQTLIRPLRLQQTATLSIWDMLA
jgi:hypothetical protein